MRDPKVVKLEGLEFNAVKDAFSEWKAAGDRLSNLVSKLTGITDISHFTLNIRYENAGFYLYEEFSCMHCNKVHEIGDPLPGHCVLTNRINLNEESIQPPSIKKH